MKNILDRGAQMLLCGLLCRKHTYADEQATLKEATFCPDKNEEAASFCFKTIQEQETTCTDVNQEHITTCTDANQEPKAACTDANQEQEMNCTDAIQEQNTICTKAKIKKSCKSKSKNSSGLLCYRDYWYRHTADISVGGTLISGVPIFVRQDTLRVINNEGSYFIPLKRIDFIRTGDGLNQLKSTAGDEINQPDK